MTHAVATTLAFVRACHPLPSLAVTAVAAGLAASADQPPATILLVAAAVLMGQLSVGWLNDLLDASRDARVGRRDKPVASGELSASAVRGGVVLAATGAVLLSLPFGLPATGVHLGALVSAWAYDLGVKATVLSVLPYAVSFGLLPGFVLLGAPGEPVPPWWLVAAAACLGCAAHFVNVVPDLADDAATGVRGLPHRLGRAASVHTSAALVLLASALLVFGPGGTPSATTVTVVAAAVLVLVTGLVRGRRPRSRAAFRAVLVVAVLDAILLIAAGVPTPRSL